MERTVRPSPCHVCGLPSWACAVVGFITKVKTKAENKFRRDRTATVWCCSRRCAVQAHAVSEMGINTHKWPMSLAEFTAHWSARLDIRKADAARTETIAETRINIGAKEGKSQVIVPEGTGAISVRKTAFKRKGGRPREWNSEADRLRAYRARTKSEAAVTA